VAKLVVNPTSANRREIALGRTLLCIGRDPSNDLVLPDAMVSRRHAVIEYRGSQYYLRDCNSSNGSVINGDRVSERGLRDGDMVAIGSARLLFREELESELAAKVVPHPSAPRLACPSCEGQYRKGDIFCRTCGAKLPEPSGPPKAVCTACGTAVVLPAHFCNACGAKLPEGAAAGHDDGAMGSDVHSSAAGLPDPRPAGPAGPAAEVPAGGPEALPGGGDTPLGPMRMDPSPAASEPAVLASPAPAAAPSLERRSGGALARAAAEPTNAVLEPDVRRAASPLAFTPDPLARRQLQSDPSLRPSAAHVSPAPARPGARALAALLDLGLVVAGEALILVPLASYWWSREVPRTADDVFYLPVLLSLLAIPVALGMGAGYFVWSWGIRGATPGQRLLDLAVEGDDGRYPIGAGRATVRLFGYLLSILSLGVGFLLVPLTGSGLHDRMSGTRVVVRRAGVL
jgi:hypothetical protein